MKTLGGSYVWSSWQDSNFMISDIRHEVQYVSTTADAIMARLLKHDDVREFCKHTRVPFINGCCDKFHPMQALADCQTVFELFGDWKNVNFVYMGVFNNVLNSLLASLPRLGVRVVALCPERNPAAYDQSLLDQAISTGRVELVENLTTSAVRSHIERANVVYTDTWIDMEVAGDPGRAAEAKARVDRFGSIQLNADNYGRSSAYIMHCMPVHSGFEIAEDMIMHERSRILQQAENRAHAQAAALAFAFSE
jgi:ornithine carbamoyltransferase